MHRRWLSLPLLSSCVSAFYPYQESSEGLLKKERRFIPYHPIGDVVDNTFTVDIKKIPKQKRDNKFPVVISNNVAAPNALPVNQDGSDFSYFSTMKFGSKGQDMYMLLDTGSANTWVMGEACNSRSCSIHNLFGQGDSDTLKVTTNPWNVNYGTGRVSGTVASDTVKFANFTLDLGFGLATTASDDFINYPMDGLLGLGRASSNRLGVPTFMENLAQNGGIASKVVGIHLHRASDGTKDGEITFGGIDSTKVQGDITYTKTSNDNEWEIPLEDAYVNDTPVKFVNKQALIDTGSSYMLIPPSDAEALHALIPGSSHNGEEYTVPCDTTANIEFGFSGVKWSMAPVDWVRKSADGGTMCLSNIVGHQAFGPDEWILGAVFLKNVYSVFDFDQASVGFGKPATGTSASGNGETTSPSGTPSPSSTSQSSTGGGSGPSPTSSTSSSANPSESQSSAPVIGNPFDLGSSQDSPLHNAASAFVVATSIPLPSLVTVFALLVGMFA